MSTILILGACMGVCFIFSLMIFVVIEKPTKNTEIAGLIFALSGLILSCFIGLVAQSLI